MREVSTTILQGYLDRFVAGDAEARDEVIRHSQERLRKLTGRMLQDFQRVRKYEETGDVLQNATVRLISALDAVKPATAVEFFRLAGRQIRRELIDLARHYFGPQGAGANERPNPGDSQQSHGPVWEPQDRTHDPHELARWCEFHRLVDLLPPEEKDVFELLWYQEVTQSEAAEILSVSVPTIKRRWLTARLLLQKKLAENENP